MKGRKLILVLVVSVIVAMAAAIVFARSRPAGTPRPAASKTASRPLIFHDEFNGTQLDKRLWNTCYEWYKTDYDGCTNYGNDESEWYKPAQVSVKDGNLILTAQRSYTPGDLKDGTYHTYEFVSGMVSTGRYVQVSPPKWTGTYGYYEARIKVPRGQAVWPAFWLLPVDHDWPPEIDIMEVLGQKPAEVLATYFWKDDAGNSQKDSSTFKASSDLSEDWHVYAVKWQAGSLEWFLDGKSIKKSTAPTVPSKPMQIILNLAVGGRLPGFPDETTPSQLEMQIDYVRAYRL